MRSDRINNPTYCAAAVMTTLAVAVMWQLSTTMFSDDIVYRHMVNGDSSDFWACRGPLVDSFAMAWQSAVNHWMEVNGRLANILYILLQPAAPWTVNLLNGIMIAVMLVMVMAYGGMRELASRRWAVVAAVALLWTAFPWNDNLQSSDYEINYVWTSVMVIGVMMLYRRAETLSGGGLCATVALAFFTGWMHEAFSLSLLAWCAVMWLASDRGRGRRFAIAVAILAGTAMCLSVSTFARLENESSTWDIANVRYMVSRIVWWMWPVYAAIVMFCYTWLKSSRRHVRAIVPDLAGLALSALVSFGIATLLVKTGRAYWPALLMAVLAIMRCWSVLPCRGRSSRASVTASWILLALYMVWGASLVYWQRAAARQQDDIYALLSASRNPTVFYNKFHNSDVPSFLMGMVDNDIDNNVFFNGLMGASLFDDPTSPFVVVLPESMKGRTFDSWDRVPGSSSLRGAWPVLVARDSIDDGRIAVTVGRPGISSTPVDLALMAIRERGLPREMQLQLKYKVRRSRDTDGSPLFIYFPELMPRTARGREVKSVELIH